MSSHVGLKRRRSDEGRAADVTLEWPLASVTAQVVSQVTMCREGHHADVALVRLLSVMDSHVNFEVAALCEPLVANIALEGFYALVRADVNLETTSPRVRFRAVGTLERQLARMDQLMCLQVASRNELLATLGVRANIGSLSSLCTKIKIR